MSDVKMIKKINKNLAAITLSTLGMATHVNAAIEKLANTQLNWQHVNIPRLSQSWRKFPTNSWQRAKALTIRQ